MIEIIKKKVSKKKRRPYYKLVFNYMIGDANGDTTEEMITSVDNPYVERFVKLLNSLKPNKGRWGLILDTENITKCFTEGQINEDDWKFLMYMMFPYYDLGIMKTPFEIEEKDIGEYDVFSDCVRGDTEYSILFFGGIDLFYYDEYGVKHKTKIK